MAGMPRMPVHLSVAAVPGGLARPEVSRLFDFS